MRSNSLQDFWLVQDWHKNHGDPTKKAKSNPPWSKDEWGATFKAALLSGPPGVGKTTSAKIVSEELGFDVKELNANDTRSKRYLHEQVEQMVVNTALTGFSSKRE